jgi:hypothetical protein
MIRSVGLRAGARCHRSEARRNPRNQSSAAAVRIPRALFSTKVGSSRQRRCRRPCEARGDRQGRMPSPVYREHGTSAREAIQKIATDLVTVMSGACVYRELHPH